MSLRSIALIVHTIIACSGDGSNLYQNESKVDQFVGFSLFSKVDLSRLTNKFQDEDNASIVGNDLRDNLAMFLNSAKIYLVILEYHSIVL